MAFPQVASTSTGNDTTSGSGAVTLPSGVVAGNRLVMVVDVDNGNLSDIIISASGTGWDKLGQENDAGAVRSALFEKKSASGDSADAVTISFSGQTIAEACSYTVYRITDHDATAALEFAVQSHTDVGDTNPSASLDAPSLTPSWGSADTLWMWAGCWDNSSRTISAFPTNYSSNQTTNVGASGASGDVSIAMATREAAASSEDPGAATISAAEQWNAWTIAIKPSGGGGGATAVTLTGPSSGTVGVSSSNFTVGANGAITGDVVVTPSDGGDGGAFSPTSVTINSGSPTGTFTYTPANVGTPTATISVTNDGGLSNPAGIDYTATAAPTGPTINTQPSNQTVTTPAAATFTVAATTSGGTLTYQWQRSTDSGSNWANVSTGTGGTSASYTTAATTVSGGDANNGDLYRCAVTDDNGTTNSSSASLTVNAAASSDVRLSIGALGERGGYFASQSVVRWRVFSLDGATLHHTGTTGSTDTGGILTIDINSAAFNVGDDVEFEVLFHDGATDPLDRTVTVIGGYITAAAQT